MYIYILYIFKKPHPYFCILPILLSPHKRKTWTRIWICTSKQRKYGRLIYRKTWSEKTFVFSDHVLRIREKSAEYKPLYFLFYAFCTFSNPFIVPNCLCPLTKWDSLCPPSRPFGAFPAVFLRFPHLQFLPRWFLQFCGAFYRVFFP